MTMLAKAALHLGERLPWPDRLTAAVIDSRVADQRRKLAGAPADCAETFAAEMAQLPIAFHTDAANTQHYEIPAAFFAHVLGPQRKYSCCLYDGSDCSLARAEENALRTTAENAQLEDGQSILELGCGWGSLTLWMAQSFPKARILAVSNSQSQRALITNEAKARGLSNVKVVTADMNDFAIVRRFDRVISIEMFEHMANWQRLLQRVRGWLDPDGRLFLHVFSHRSTPYRFSEENEDDWIAQHFFTGGFMPSHPLIRQFSDVFTVEEEWRWEGAQYARTAQDWLANFDAEEDAVAAILKSVYGREARLWHRRWRLFLLATAGLFGHACGDWGVSHYRLAPA